MEAVCPGSFPANNLFSYQASPEKFGTAQPSPLALNPLAPLTSVIPMPAELHAGLTNSANFIRIRSTPNFKISDFTVHGFKVIKNK
jgi:hypothetical protein